MTVGDKIRTIRCLRNMTQKELGIKAGFPKASADVRIRQYESDKMVPKTDKLAAIAKALEVDISALSNVNISTIDELMHVFFELESQFNISIQKDGNSFALVFSDVDKINRNLLYALDVWYHKKSELLTHKPDIVENYSKMLHEYEVWTASYPLDIKAKETYDRKLVIKKYNDLITDQQEIKIETYKDFIICIEDMLQNDIRCIFDYQHIGVGRGKTIISFNTDDLLSYTNDKAVSFLNFIKVINYFKEKGILIENDTHTFEQHTYLEYHIHDSKVGPLISFFVELEDAIKNNKQNDTMFQFNYNNTLGLYNIKIE